MANEEMSREWVKVREILGDEVLVRFVDAKGRPKSSEPGWLDLGEQIVVELSKSEGKDPKTVTFYKKPYPQAEGGYKEGWVSGMDYSWAGYRLGLVLGNMFHVWQHLVQYNVPAEKGAK